MNGLIVLRQRSRAVGNSDTAEIEGQELRARRRVFMLTGRAGTAGVEGEHHVIARLDAFDLGSHGLDDAGSLMAKNYGHRDRKAVTAGDVGMTDADANHPDQYLIFARRRLCDPLESARTADFAQYGGLCRRNFRIAPRDTPAIVVNRSSPSDKWTSAVDRRPQIRDPSRNRVGSL